MAAFYIPTSKDEGFRFSMSGQHRVLIAILVGVKWYLTMGSICISLMTDDAEYPSMGLLAICIFSLKKSLFESFAKFLIGLSFVEL